MALNLTSPWLNHLNIHSLHHHRCPSHSNEAAASSSKPQFLCNLRHQNSNIKASLSESQHEGVVAGSNDADYDLVIERAAAAKDASEALELFGEMTERSGGVVSTSDCRLIISAALDRDNADLALSIFKAMRSSFDAEKGIGADRWRWSRPDVNTYSLLVRGLAASLRVSDALKIIASVCRVGVSPAEEVPFGKTVRCPTCMIAVAVAQPQNGIQACTKTASRDLSTSGLLCY